MIHLTIATRNQHKLVEIAQILSPWVICSSILDYPTFPQLSENGITFEENAIQKSTDLGFFILKNSKNSTAEFVLADDSGLEVDYLNGAPGVHSARYAANDSNTVQNASDSANNEKLLHHLKGVPYEKRTARFRCAMALTDLSGINSDVSECLPILKGKTQVFTGICQGHILEHPLGNHGFGYDPLFVPLGYQLTFAELDGTVKNVISHRAKALTELRAFIEKLQLKT